MVKIIEFYLNPYMGVIIAYHLGAKNIGLIGVDLNNQNCYKDRMGHSQIQKIPQIKTHFNNLIKFFKFKKYKFFIIYLKFQCLIIYHINLYKTF